MALGQQPQDLRKNTSTEFKNIKLLKNETLGIGSYGKVCVAKCDKLRCAAKIIHETLFDPTAAQQMSRKHEHRLPIRRFEQECDFLNTLRHPNIIQYLGMWQDPDTGLPVLLMELMDESLTHFLETATRSIPYHIQVNICYDIALALSYLHTNGIIHRDLSSNNVLLIGNVRAKVTDFGMAKLTPQIIQHTFTMCPGTDVYMPPEAVQYQPVYTEKIDCFSFGVVVLQILTREFPKPGDRALKVKKRHLMKCIPEVDRRQNHISQVAPNHTLLPIILDCLKDRDTKRPSAQQLCERIVSLKERDTYAQSKDAFHIDTILQELRVQHAREIQILQEAQANQIKKQDEYKRWEIQEIIQSHSQALADKEKEILQLRKKLEQITHTVGMKETKEQDTLAPQECSVLKQPQIINFVSGFSHQMDWIRLKLTIKSDPECRAPCIMSREADATVCGNKLYLPKGRDIHVYNSLVTAADEAWSQIPATPTYNYSLAVIDNRLTTIGGTLEGKFSNKLFCLEDKHRKLQWTELLPPMPTKRACTNALYSLKVLIVAGGQGESGDPLSKVEILNMDMNMKQWCVVASLPSPTLRASMTLSNGYIYVLGGTGANQQQQRSVFRCSLSTLLQSSYQQHVFHCPPPMQAHSVWSSVADLPVTWSTCLSFHKLPLAVGGNLAGKPTNNIYAYSSDENSWSVVENFSIGRHLCYASVLSNDNLVIVGGWTGSGFTDSMEVAKAEL